MDDQAKLIALSQLIASDSYAVTFQSMGQYRSALLQEVAHLLKQSPKATPERAQ